MITAKIFLISVMLFVSLAKAEIKVCTKVSKSDKTTKSVNLKDQLGPVRNQDSVGWCYAFTVADLLTQHLHNKGELRGDPNQKNQQVSPVGIASYYNKKNYPKYYKRIEKMSSKELQAYNKSQEEKLALKGKKWDTLKVVPQGGVISNAFEDIKKTGFCMESDAPSESFSIVMAKFCIEKKICVKNLEEMLNSIYDRANFNKTNKDELCDLYDVVHAAYPTIPEQTLNPLLLKTSRDKIFYDLAQAACIQKTNFLNLSNKKINIKYSSIDDEKPKVLLQMIDGALEKGNVPAISYYAQFLTVKDAKKDFLHASTIVGKYYDPKACEVIYILRNSWGETCDPYQVLSKDFYLCKFQVTDEQLRSSMQIGDDPSELKFAKERYCAEKFPGLARNPNLECDPKTGYLFVKKSELKKYLLDVTYLQD